MEPKLPPDLTPDPTAAGRACSVEVSFRAGGDGSFGSKEEGPGRTAMLGRAPPEGEAYRPKWAFEKPDWARTCPTSVPLHLLQGASVPPFPRFGARPSTR